MHVPAASKKLRVRGRLSNNCTNNPQKNRQTLLPVPGSPTWASKSLAAKHPRIPIDKVCKTFTDLPIDRYITIVEGSGIR
jgi:hypothetical protein